MDASTFVFTIQLTNAIVNYIKNCFVISEISIWKKNYSSAKDLLEYHKKYQNTLCVIITII